MCTEMAKEDGTGLREVSSRCCLTTAGKTGQLLLNNIYISFLPSLYSFADFENPALRDAEAAVDPVRVGGGGAAAAAEAPGKNSVEKFRLQF